MAKVYFGSVAVTKPSAPSTLPGKLQRILKKCNLTRLCSGDWVPIKMHLGGGLGYSTVHPLLVRMVTEAVQEAGGKPVVVDGYFETVAEAHLHGYTRETVGCPIVAAGGVFNSHVLEKRAGYLTYDTAEIFGLIAEAKCLINLSHVKGHGVCAYGGACKNIAMGCVNGRTRRKIHALQGGIDWVADRCRFCGKCAAACDRHAIEIDPKKKTLHIDFHACRYCRHCALACPEHALVVNDERGFRHFQEGMAITTKLALEHLEPERLLHINLLTDITMFCDCWGITTPSMVPDIGVLASHDIVAIEQASLDMIRTENFIEGSLIGDAALGEGTHLLEKIHGKDPFVQVDALERHGLGSRKYELEEVF